jgi:hypothetical protein
MNTEYEGSVTGHYIWSCLLGRSTVYWSPCTAVEAYPGLSFKDVYHCVTNAHHVAPRATKRGGRLNK